MHKASGYVYVIGNHGNGVVKIGYTGDVERRLKELATAWHPSAVDPTQLAALRTYYSDKARHLEQAIHAQFALSRMHRPGFIARPGGREGWTEWFNLGPRPLGMIDDRISRILKAWSRHDA